MVIKDPCKLCKKAVGVKHKAVHCDQCNTWVHIKCNFINKATYKKLQQSNDSWFCISCMKENVPYSKLTDEELQCTVAGKSTNNISFNSGSALRLNPSWSDNDLYKQLNNIQSDSIEDTNFSKYHDINDLNLATPINDKNLSIFHMNISSLQYHIDDLKQLLSQISFEFDVIGITETRLHDLTKTNITLPGYCIEHTPTKSANGGALLYINSKKVNHKPRKDLNIGKDKELESIFIELVFPNKKNIIVGCIYRHPCMDTREFNNIYLSPLLEKISFEKKPTILMGDFNINLLNHATDADSSDFLDLMTSNSFAPCITRPTRVTSRSRTLIDNIFINSIHDNLTSGNLTTSISDHLPQFVLLPCTSEPLPKKAIYRRNFKNFDSQNFILDLLGIDWGKHLQIENNNVDSSMKTFLDIFEALLNRYAPLKKLSNKEIRQKQKPWITPGILKSIQTRDFLHKKWCTAKNSTTKHDFETKFKKYRASITSLIKISKEDYHKQFFAQNKHDLKKTWEGIKSIINLKSTNPSSPSCISSNGTTTTDPLDIATSFNKYFSNIANKVKQKIPPTNSRYQDYLQHPNQNSFFLNAVTEKELLLIINDLAPKKSTGPASIPTGILKRVEAIICKPLSCIINLSFSTGKFPETLKKASIVPIHKSDSKLECSNYRPISLLSNLGKIIEKLMHNRLMNFLEKHLCIFPNQYGFRSKHSINHALIQMTEKVRKAIDNKSFACGVFVDLQKAFDTVSHPIMLEKLKHYGVRGVTNNWFRSYLFSREQCVTINNCNSSYLKITHGVPQGSVLGPLLFLIYINDLNKAIKFSDTHHFADDTNLLYVNKSLKKINKHVNHDLKLLCNWLRANEISLNTKKTEIILFRSRNRTIDKQLNFRLSGQKINLSNAIKYLGIIIDEHLTWSNHINILACKLSRANGMLSKIRHYVSYKTLISIYYAIFNSHLTFGSQIWCQDSSDLTKRISILQNKALRIINFKSCYDSADILYAKSRILKIHDYVDLLNCQMVKQFSQNLLPTSFQDYFTQNQDIHDHCTKAADSGDYHIQQINTNYGKNSITNKCIEMIPML